MELTKFGTEKLKKKKKLKELFISKAVCVCVCARVCVRTYHAPSLSESLVSSPLTGQAIYLQAVSMLSIKSTKKKIYILLHFYLHNGRTLLTHKFTFCPNPT